MTQSKGIHLLKTCPYFSHLVENEFVDLLERGQLRAASRGEKLFQAGEEARFVYLILSGSSKLVRSHPDGKDRIVHFLIRGDLFGALVALQGKAYPVTAVILEQSNVFEIPSSSFQELIQKGSPLGRILFFQMSERMRAAHDDRVNVFDSVDKRISFFLLDLLDRLEKSVGPTSRIPIPLTRQDIADRVGSTVETVIRTLSSWAEEGIISTQDRHIEIIQRPFLQSLLKN